MHGSVVSESASAIGRLTEKKVKEHRVSEETKAMREVGTPTT
jgi:hypothetical protein